MRYFQKESEYKKRYIYTSTHYLHLLQSLHHTDFSTLFNSHLHQLIIHEILPEDDIISIVDSPFVDLNYIYQHQTYSEDISKHIQNTISQKNRSIDEARKRCKEAESKYAEINKKYYSKKNNSSISTTFSPHRKEKKEVKEEREETKEDKKEDTKEEIKEDKSEVIQQKDLLYEYFASSKSIDYSIYEGCNLLLIAALKEHDKLVHHLLNHFDIQTDNFLDSSSPKKVAAPLEVVNCKNQKNHSLLLICCEKSLHESSKYLLSHPHIDINVFNEEYEHLLITCCKNKLNNQALQILSHNSFKTNHHDHAEKSYDDPKLYIMERAFGYACRNGMCEVVYQILDHYKLHVHMLNVSVNNPLYWCAHHKMEDALLRLLEYHDIDLTLQEHGKKHTAFELMCINSLVDVSLTLLKFVEEKKVHVDFKENRDGDSPFYYACSKGLTEVALKILELTQNKIQLIYKSNEDDNSLIYACFYNMDSVIKIILQTPGIRTEYINSSSYHYGIPLILCCKHKNEKRALQILKLGMKSKSKSKSKSIDIDTSQLGRNQKSALYYAIKHNLRGVISILIHEPILHAPFIKKMFDMLLYYHPENQKYSSLIHSYKKSPFECSICKICRQEENYIVRCKKCEALFHTHCLSEKLKKDFFCRCVSCREESEFYLCY